MVSCEYVILIATGSTSQTLKLTYCHEVFAVIMYMAICPFVLERKKRRDLSLVYTFGSDM